MRLHSLELAAIGPFATTQHIDFEQLQASGLFLLDGPTGAGKTTVLDAITFALFGPGENRGDGRLHSDFATPEVEPFVTLEFSLRGVRYRLRRTPEYERPKRRGDGFTTAHATAHLQRWQGGSWVSRSSNKAEIAELLDDELGLTREQFRQVVLLPQGDFAAFLRANDDERRGVLSRLFGTGLYQRLTDELDARRAEAAREIAAARERVTTCVAVAAEAAGESPGAGSELCALDPAARDEQLTVLQAALERRRSVAVASIEQLTVAASLARAEAQAAASAAAVLVRFVQAQAEYATHAAKADKVDAAREQLALARRAEPVRSVLALLDDADQHAQAACALVEPGADAEAVSAALREARELVTAGEVAAGQRAALLARVAAARDVLRLTPLVAEAQRALTVCVDAHHSATEQHLRLLELRLAGMAAELAGALVDGEPCSVCGSADHPRPAVVAPDAVDARAVTRARAERDAAEQRRQSAEHALAERANELAAAEAVAGDAEFDELQAELAALDATVAAGRQAAAAEQRLGRAAELANDADNARSAAAKVRRQAEREARRAGFADLETARAAVLATDVYDAIDARVRSWDERATHLRGALDDEHFAELRSLSQEEVETRHRLTSTAVVESTAAASRADAARDDALADADAALRALERFVARRAELAAAAAALAELEQRSATVIHLAKLARGMAGQRRVALTTYVLRHWFEHVVDAANVRLSSISSGRYSLVRVDEGDTKAERAGLTLNVVDAHTGEARSPRSLSGGETFYTSLALALGLADVVRAEAGGVDLDTLFIDEGFGTLDPNTLEQVMSVIDELRDRGRVVGIVSHVADLKERIPERLEVRRLPDGSSTLRVVA